MRSIRRGLHLLNYSHGLAACLNSIPSRNAHLENLIFPFSSSPITEHLWSPLTIGNQISFFNCATLSRSNLSDSDIGKPAIVGGSGKYDGFIGEADGDDEDEDDDDGDGDGIDDGDVTSEDDNDSVASQLGAKDEFFNHDVGVILEMLRSMRSSQPPTELNTRGVINCTEVRTKLDQCGISVTPALVVELLSRIRNDWEAAFTFFLWAGKQQGYVHSLREFHSMISILAKRRKFDTAWNLINEMRGGKDGSSIVTPDTLLIMIRRYCAVHDVGSAINTFHALKRFNFHVGMEEFQKLLAALCRYKNVQDAEHLLFSNKNTFPFETKSFNIILNGWCNVIGSTREGKRFWRVMIERGIKVDVVSYSSIISTYAKSNRLKEVLRLYNRMKRMGIAPDRKVYNAVIHALAKGGLVKESLNLLRTMEEMGIGPNTVTYNSLIKPLCRARKCNEAQKVFDEMLQRGLQPTIRTYHAFLRVQRTGEAIFVLLDKMKETGCPPNKDTYIMLIRKFCRWRQLDNVFKLWDQMSENGLNDDCSSYIVLIHGLFLNSKLEEAYRIYMEMKEKSLLPDAKTDGLIQTWLSNKQMAVSQTVDSEVISADHDLAAGGSGLVTNKFDKGINFQKQPETRKLVKEQGYSFWEQ